MSQEYLVVGKRLPRPDAFEKATGAAKYTADIKLPGMLIAKVLRSPYPHAKILKIDTSKAEKVPGVEGVITLKDVPQKAFNSSFSNLTTPPQLAKRVVQDQHVLSDKARFVGDPIAAVAAINEMVADEASDLIEVEYEQLPAVFEPEEALKPGAPKIHDFAENNIVTRYLYPFAQGDVEEGFQEADYVVEEAFRTTRQKHCQLEPSACIASLQADGRLTIWSHHQEIHIARRGIAEIFDLPEGKVRWLSPHIGGGFGLRGSVDTQPICAALALKTGKPVKLEYTRDEDFIATGSRQPLIQTIKMGVKKDGTITALQIVKGKVNAGAYCSHSAGTTAVSVNLLMALYRCANVAGDVDIIYTNTPHTDGMRGYGNTRAMFVLEQLVDMVAEKLGMDPMEFRLKNHRRTGEPSWFPSQPIESCPLDECTKRGAEKIGWYEKRAKKGEGVKRTGIGIATFMHVSGAHPFMLEHSSAYLKLSEDASVNLAVSASEIGQGILGALAQIAAEELGLHSEDVHVVNWDTDTTPFDVGTRASRNAYITGNAVLAAARDAKSQLLERAAKMLEVPAQELEVKDRRIYVRATPEKRISVAEVAKNAIYNFDGECLQISGRASFEPEKQAPPYTAVFAEVEVDIETGEVNVSRIVVAHDIGQAINPATAEGQIEGAVVQGLGYALTEDYIINKDSGIVESDNFNSYKIPSTMDLPEIEVILVEQPIVSGPFGAKSVGESGIIGVAPAIANAVYHAIGVRITELPITPEKILGALKAKALNPLRK